MLRQLLSTTSGVSSGTVSSANEYYHDHCSIYPLNSLNFENATVTLPPPPLLQPPPSQHSSQTLPPPPLPPSLPPPLPPPLPSSSSSSVSISSSSSLSLPVPSSPTPSSSLPSSVETVATVTSQNHFPVNDDKNMATAEYMSLAAAYNMQTPIVSNNLGILDTNNDLNDTTELFSSTYAMLSADSTLSWNVWDEQTRFSNNTNHFATNNQLPMNMNNHDFGAYPVHTTTPGCSNSIGYQTCNTDQIDNNYTTNCRGLLNDNRLDFQQQVVLSNSNDVGSRNYGQQEKCTNNLNQVTQPRFPDANQRMAILTTGSGSTGGNYLDQMGGFVENMRICDPRNIINSNNINPVCPYCDRFISHYKGNIRRHVNQCMKSTRIGNKLKRKDAIGKQFNLDKFQFGDGCNERMTYSESYQPNVLETSVAEKSSWMINNNYSGLLAENQSIAKIKSYSVKKDRGNDDPFRCPLCDFATIYKGNMKRHLSTCHGLQDDDLKDGCIDKLKYKEAIDSRVENVSRSNKRKSSQYLKGTPKLAQMDSDNGPSSSIIVCNTIEKLSEKTTTDISPTTFPVVPAFNNDEENEPALPVINPSDSTRVEVRRGESLSELMKASSNDNTNQLLRFSTIDETIEAVIANGNENSSSEMGTNNNNNNNNGNDVNDDNNNNGSNNDSNVYDGINSINNNT